MLVHTGRGKYLITRDSKELFACCLYNFDIDGADLKKDHEPLLRSEGRIMTFLVRGGSAAILGVTSTTADPVKDLDLSRRRAESVAAHLRHVWDFTRADIFYNGPMRLQKVDWQGKELPLRLGQPDEHEDDRWRSVWVRAWSNQAPPPVSDIVSDMSMPELSGPTQIGKGLDIASWISGLTIGEAVPVLDMAISTAATLAALPVAWVTADQLAYNNGFILGRNNAMQDMADAFSDSALTHKSQSAWPDIPHPSPQWANQSTAIAGQQKWKDGEKDGCEKAFQQVTALERSPKTVTWKKGTETGQYPLTGKLYLRVLSRGLKDKVAAFFMLQSNQWLRSQNMKPWPTSG